MAASVRMVAMPELFSTGSTLPRAGQLSLALLFVLICPPLFAWPISVELTAAEVEYGGFRLEQVAVQSLGEAGVSLSIGKLGSPSQPGLEANGINLECSQLGSAEEGFCPDGAWQLKVLSTIDGWQQPMQGTVSEAIWNGQKQSLASSLLAGKFTAQLHYSGGDVAPATTPALELSWVNQALADLPFKALLPTGLDWIKSGSSSGTVTVPIPETTTSGQTKPVDFSMPYQFELKGISLDSPDGRFAAEGLDLAASGYWQPGSPAQLLLKARFLAGEVLLDQFYTSFGSQPLQLNTRLALKGERVEVRELNLSDGQSLDLQASASFDLQHPASTLKYQVSQLNLQFPLAYERYLEPVLAPMTLDKLTVTGGFSWTGSGAGGEFPSGTLRFEDLSVVDHDRDRFAFTGMKANIEAGQSSGQSEFSWRGMLLGRINLGAGQIDLKTSPGSFALGSPLKLAVLGGEFLVDEFSLQLPPADAAGADPVVKFNAGLKDMDMEQLTAALGWPTFGGKVSGRIPGASYNQGVLTVDGVLSFEAFDGQIQLSNLRVERLFGVLPSFAADLDVHNLDLQMLTSAFSFGSIAGRLDGYVRDLRMLDWSPVSFDAWVGTPTGQEDSRSISRQAVNNLTSIGGGGATAALTGPIMRMFSNFSYRRLGMGCKLENYVCAIRGLEDDDNSVVIMEGSGIPKLSIRVFNRRMDWPQLVANLTAATAGEGIRIGDP